MDDIVGKLRPPITDMPPAIRPDGTFWGPIDFLNNILRLGFIAAGLWVFVNIIIAGFMFINAAAMPKLSRKPGRVFGSRLSVW